MTGFKQTTWWDNHRKVNRHHLLQADAGVPEDVNLIDVLDMICDCVMAGMARSGSVYSLQTLTLEVLRRAFENTVWSFLLKAHVEGCGMSNPVAYRYEANWTIEQHRDELIERLGKAITRINELGGRFDWW